MGRRILNQRVSSLHFSSALIISKLCLRSQLSERERAGVATVFWSCISDVRSISTGLQNILKGIYNFTELIRRQVTSLHKGEFAFTAQEIHVLISPQRT